VIASICRPLRIALHRFARSTTVELKLDSIPTIEQSGSSEFDNNFLPYPKSRVEHGVQETLKGFDPARAELSKPSETDPPSRSCDLLFDNQPIHPSE
jgi:hypothetical protein